MPSDDFVPTVRIQAAPFDAAEETRRLRTGRTDLGALVSFEGVCRDRDGAAGPAVQAMELEHYPGMTETSIAAMITEARGRWPLQGVTVVHRIGLLLPGDPIVLVAVASVHRQAAFQACAFLMDYLKTQAPFWKKETTDAGARWVDARESDDAALASWGISATNAKR